MAPDRYTCEEIFRRLDDYLDRELNAEEQELVRKHLDTCAVCAMEYRFESSTLRQLKDKIRRITVPSDLFKRISRALEAEPPGTGTGGQTG